MGKEKPFSGVRVVELSTHVAAPSCGRMITDWGADVIKVEPVGGEDFRYFGPSYGVPATDGENPIFDQLNGNKRGLALNLKTGQGMEIMHKLLASSDVFITNNRRRALVKLGLDYETLKIRYPRLICATITGYGDQGPDKNQPGFDTAAFWASSGFLIDMVVGEENSYPVNVPSGFGDIVTASNLFAGISSALYAREKTGVGDYVTVSLYASALWCMSLMSVATQDKYGFKYPKGRYDTVPTPYRTKDGKWIIPTLLGGYEKNFPALCHALGLAEFIEDPRFRTKADFVKPANKEFCIKAFEQRFAQRTASDWVERLDEAGAVYQILRTMKENMVNEQAWANGFIRKHTMPNGESCTITVPPIRTASIPDPAFQRAPLVGEHSEEILLELGYSKQDVGRLFQKGIVNISTFKD